MYVGIYVCIYVGVYVYTDENTCNISQDLKNMFFCVPPVLKYHVIVILIC